MLRRIDSSEYEGFPVIPRVIFPVECEECKSIEGFRLEVNEKSGAQYAHCLQCGALYGVEENK